MEFEILLFKTIRSFRKQLLSILNCRTTGKALLQIIFQNLAKFGKRTGGIEMENHYSSPKSQKVPEFEYFRGLKHEVVSSLCLISGARSYVKKESFFMATKVRFFFSNLFLKLPLAHLMPIRINMDRCTRKMNN